MASKREFVPTSLCPVCLEMGRPKDYPGFKAFIHGFSIKQGILKTDYCKLPEGGGDEKANVDKQGK